MVPLLALAMPRTWLLFLGCLLASLNSCDSLPPENQALKKRMADAIRLSNTQPVGDTLRLDMTTITDFPWDTLYTFTKSVGPELLSKDIGMTWPVRIASVVDDDEKLFIFMHKGQLADYIEFNRNDDPSSPSSVSFVAYFALGELFTPATAKFELVRQRGAYGYPDSVSTIDVMRPKKEPVYRHTNPLAQLPTHTTSCSRSGGQPILAAAPRAHNPPAARYQRSCAAPRPALGHHQYPPRQRSRGPRLRSSRS
jgi:hypothetical protein